MSRRFQKPIPEEPFEIEVPGLWRVYFLAMGIAIFIGLVGGSLWIAWRLLIAPWFE